jgi:hypothetical protein
MGNSNMVNAWAVLQNCICYQESALVSGDDLSTQFLRVFLFGHLFELQPLPSCSG